MIETGSHTRRSVRLCQLVVIALLVLGAGPRARARDESRLRAEEEKLELLTGKLQALRAELRSLDRRESSLLGELHRLELEIRVASDELELLGLELDRGYREMDETLERIQALERSIDELKPFLERRARSLYQLGRLSYLRLLLSVEKPSELTRAYRYISRLAREDAVQMNRFLEDQELLQKSKAELVEQTEKTLAMREQLAATTRSLENRKASREALLAEVTGRQEMAGALVHELEQARGDLTELVDSLAQGGSPEGETVFLPMRMFEGEIGWPVEGELDGRFGTQLHPRFQTVTVRNGIEIAAPPERTVRSVYDGRVVFASWFQGYGNLLIVEHPGGVHSLYGYLSDFAARAGDRVEAGAPVAYVGDTGSLSGPRLYFEIRVDGKPVDPEKWLDPSRKLAPSH